MNARLFILAALFIAAYASRGPLEGNCMKECADECFWRGTCVNHHCVCTTGWNGTTCETKTCDVDTCLFGFCKDGDCHCHTGWAGDRCDILLGVSPFTRPVCTPFGYCTCDAQGTQCTGGELPDFEVIPTAVKPLLEFRTFKNCSCAIDARVPCAKVGQRKLLRFTTEVLNVGAADLFVGNPADWNEVEGYPLWKWHACHKHQHFEHWIDYRLRRIDDPTFVLVGAKSGSSVLDSFPSRTASNRWRKFNEKVQGLQVGWIDWYPQFLDCQWIDVTDMPLGDYQLEIIVNPNRVLKESTYDNNIKIVPIKCDPQCVNGLCNFAHGCVCHDGWSGPTCETEEASNHTCQSNCTNKVCGHDGCGSTCGVCPDNFHCNGSRCICSPQCAGKTCGDDGCGGVCGTCTSPNECNEDGVCTCVPRCSLTCGVDDGCGGTCQCPKPWSEVCINNKCESEVCAPNCTNAACGHDGCGGSCGDCTGQDVCSHGACVCKPNCGGKHCGPDGCGGSCGICAHDEMTCSNAGQCVCQPDCTNKDCGFNGCNGTCGECAIGQHCLNHVCKCQPVCEGKTCGDDGCGGLCSGVECETEQPCECAEGYCGVTECGKTCTCGANKRCEKNMCVACLAGKCGSIVHDPIKYPLSELGGHPNRIMTLIASAVAGVVVLLTVIGLVAAAALRRHQ